jgi:hypothetical protein
MSKHNICKIMEAENCHECGYSSLWRPCEENIPNHIPEVQVKKWLLVRRLENV